MITDPENAPGAYRIPLGRSMAWGPGTDNRFSDGGPDGTGWTGGTDAGAAGGVDGETELAWLAADARTDERVAQRRRRRWLQRAAAESTTFSGLLDTLAELDQRVEVVLSTGKRVQGRVTVVGSDVVALRDGPDGLVLVALARVVALDAGDRPSLAADGTDRPGAADRPALRHLLAELAEGRPEVHVAFDGGALDGRLLWVGEDVAALGVQARAVAGDVASGSTGFNRTRYVRLSSVTDVSLSVSG